MKDENPRGFAALGYGSSNEEFYSNLGIYMAVVGAYAVLVAFVLIAKGLFAVSSKPLKR